jgi:predicted Zn-dependent protease
VTPQFENRLPPDDVNVGRTNVLLEFFLALLGFFLLVAVFVLFVYLGGSLLARHIPFAWEDRIAEQVMAALPDGDKARSAKLQQLADKLATGLVLPEGMHFDVSYIKSDEVNAFATLGGHIMLHSALIDRLESENALAMVLAHEMAHIIHRDPADAVGGRLGVALAMGIMSSAIGADALERMVGTAQNLTLLSFSREAEKRADLFAIALVARHYGHLAGAADVFRELAAYEQEHQLLAAPELLNSHPDTLRRIELLEAEAQKLGVSLDGKLTPMPASLRTAKE